MKNILLLMVFLFSVAFSKTTVTTVLPGDINDPFWGNVGSVMNVAAQQLDLSLEIIYGDRNFMNTLKNSEEVLHRSVKPDFLIIVNEDGLAERILPEADSLGVKCVVFNEGFSKEYIEKNGEPTEVFDNCIAEITPDDSLAGFLLAEELIKSKKKEVGDAPLSIFAISGSPRTSSSDQRVAGLKEAVKKYAHTNILQIVPGFWDKEKAMFITEKAQERYDTIDIIWCASDLMADGVVDKRKSSEIMTGGIDWADIGLHNVADGKVAASVGGHFFEGAWTLVLVYDYIHLGPLPNKRILSNSFGVANSSNISNILTIVQDADWQKINFKDFSKYENKTLDMYDFNLNKIFKYYDK